MQKVTYCNWLYLYVMLHIPTKSLSVDIFKHIFYLKSQNNKKKYSNYAIKLDLNLWMTAYMRQSVKIHILHNHVMP